MIPWLEGINFAFQTCHIQSKHFCRINFSGCTNTVYLKIFPLVTISKLLHGKLSTSKNLKFCISFKTDIAIHFHVRFFHTDLCTRNIGRHHRIIRIRIHRHDQTIFSRCNRKILLCSIFWLIKLKCRGIQIYIACLKTSILANRKTSTGAGPDCSNGF